MDRNRLCQLTTPDFRSRTPQECVDRNTFCISSIILRAFGRTPQECVDRNILAVVAVVMVVMVALHRSAWIEIFLKKAL